MATVFNYTKGKIDELLGNKSNVGHTHSGSDVTGDISVSRVNFTGASAYLDAEGDGLIIGGGLTITGDQGYAAITTFYNSVQAGSTAEQANSIEWRGGVAILHIDVTKESAGNLDGFNLLLIPSSAPAPKRDIQSQIPGNRNNATAPGAEIRINAGARTVTAFMNAGSGLRFKGDVVYFY